MRSLFFVPLAALLLASPPPLRAEDPPEEEAEEEAVAQPPAASTAPAAPAAPAVHGAGRPGAGAPTGFGPFAPIGGGKPGFYDQKDVEVVRGGPDRPKSGIVPKLQALPWDGTQQKLPFPANGVGYSIKFVPATVKAGKTGAGAGGGWSWSITQDTRKGCQYMGLVSSDAAGKSVLCRQGLAVGGNLSWNTAGAGAAGSCALKDGRTYWFHLYLAAAVGENPASMVAAGKVMCSAWLYNNGAAEYP